MHNSSFIHRPTCYIQVHLTFFSSATKNITRLLRNSMVNRRVQKITLLVPILSQISSVHTLTPCFLGIHFNIILLFAPRSSEWSLTFTLSNQNVVRIYHSLMRATYLAHLTVLDLIFLIIFCEEYNLRSSSLCNFLQPPVCSLFMSPNILLSTLFWNALNLC
jgi:hypothetical protein